MAAPRRSVFLENLRVVRFGLLLSLLAILFGFGLGAAFGGLEGTLKAGLADSAAAVKDRVYGGDEGKIAEVVGRGWTYYKRAHMHGGGIGNTALLLILLVAALSRPPSWVRQGLSWALGLGALGYSSFWLFAGRLAPSLGGTAQAKEAMSFLAIPSAALLIVGVVGVMALVGIELFGGGGASGRQEP